MTLQLDRMSFRYRRRDEPIFRDLSLTVFPGRTVLLGPNGAGKSTLLALLATAIRPTSGQVLLGERDPWSRRQLAAVRRHLAWMPQATQVAPGLSAREHVALHGWLAGMSKPSAWEKAGPALERVGLVGLLDRRATKLSGGQRARMGLAQALVLDASTMLLDEPVAALDPDQREKFSEILTEVSVGRTVVVLAEGTVRAQESVDDFLHDNGTLVSPVEAYRRAIGQEK